MSSVNKLMVLADHYAIACTIDGVLGDRPERDYLRTAIEQAIKDEREACAALCDPEPDLPNEAYLSHNVKAAMRRCARSIRQRSDT